MTQAPEDAVRKRLFNIPDTEHCVELPYVMIL